MEKLLIVMPMTVVRGVEEEGAVLWHGWVWASAVQP